MSENLPCLRKDLCTSVQEIDEGRYCIIKIPETGQFHRFGEAEYFIIEQLDGTHSTDDICEKIAAKFNAELDEVTLLGFIASLKQRGLLETTETRANQQNHQQRRLKGSLFYLRFSAFDPDQLLTYLDKKLRFIYTPYFVGLSALLILLSWLVMISHADEIQRDLASHLSAGTLLTVWIVVLLTVSAHEFAHGLTCKHFGGEVHEIGLLLMFFMPAFFCNVSDAWLFSKKSRRLWVTFAGAYCELFLWSMAVLVWRITAPEAALNFIALIMVGTSGIRILFNFNPLIKLDGYYLLSDYLEIPNLRTRAAQYVGYRIKRLFNSESQLANPVSPREQKIFLIYGLCAGLFSVLLLGYLASLLGGFLIDSFQGPGFLIFMVLLMLVFKNSLSRLLRKCQAFITEKQSLKTLGTKKIAAFASALLLLLLVDLNLTISGEFQVFPDHNADIRAKVDAIIEEIYVREGELVKQGDAIARLSDREPRSELKKVEAHIQEQTANLQLLLAGPMQEDIALARGEIVQAETRYQHTLIRAHEADQMHDKQLSMLQSEMEKAKDQLNFARKREKRLQTLAEKKLISEIKLEEANEEASVRHKEFIEARAEWKMALADVNASVRKELAEAESAIKKAKAELEVLLAGSRSEEIDATRAVISGLRGEQEYLQTMLSLVHIVSPIDGVVTTPKPVEKVGQRVEKGDLILEVYDTRLVKVETFIPEKEIGDIKLGQKVILKARAYPDKDFSGTVAAIAPIAMEDDTGLGLKVVRVITEIENTGMLLKPAMTGHSKIYSGKRSIIDLLTRRLVRYLRVEFWSWW